MKQVELGEAVVVPGMGVGRVAAREVQEVGDAKVELFRIDLGERTRMLVPVGRLIDQGIRRVIPASKVEQVWSVLEDVEVPKKRGHWNRRRQRYNAALLENRPSELAGILGELAVVKKNKGLSFGERTLFEKIKRVLLGELAAAAGKPETHFEQRLAAVA